MGEMHPVQRAFVEYGAIQCGFCSPGMILTAKALLDENPSPTEQETRQAISVGEGSHVAIRDVRVTDAAIGVASKDRSRTRVESSTFSGIEHAALMAYVKKPQYGPAEIEASGVHIEGARREAVAQLGSRISLDGRTVEPEPLDVDALYDSGAMRK